MKVLIINESYKGGGTEVQTRREFNILRRHGHEVYLLTLDPSVPENVDCCIGNELNIPIKFSGFNKQIHRIIKSGKWEHIIEKLVDDINPDVIHLNRTHDTEIDVYHAIQKYPTVQTLRDYGYVCPNNLCIDNNLICCKGYKYGSCRQCLSGNPKLLIRSLFFDYINNLRKKSVNLFVAPSEALSIACTENGLTTRCINNPFDFSVIKKNIPMLDTATFLYYGLIAEHKGVSRLIDAFEEFHRKNLMCKLMLAGKCDKSYKAIFDSILKKPFVEYVGEVTNEQIMEIYRNIYCVIVPSLWIENYPNTVLEAIANKTLVIGSNRGGIPELIGDSRFLFDVLDHKDIVQKLKYAWNLSDEEYIKVVNSRYDKIKHDNSENLYYQKIMSAFSIITSDKR